MLCFQQFPSTLFCKLRVNVEPGRNGFSKYHVSLDYYTNSTFPDHCDDAAMLISLEAVQTILDQTKNVPFLSLPSVLYTGILAERAGVHLHRSKVFGHNVSWIFMNFGIYKNLFSSRILRTPKMFRTKQL
jgi:hypothetical protein